LAPLLVGYGAPGYWRWGRPAGSGPAVVGNPALGLGLAPAARVCAGPSGDPSRSQPSLGRIRRNGRFPARGWALYLAALGGACKIDAASGRALSLEVMHLAPVFGAPGWTDSFPIECHGRPELCAAGLAARRGTACVASALGRVGLWIANGCAGPCCWCRSMPPRHRWLWWATAFRFALLVLVGAACLRDLGAPPPPTCCPGRCCPICDRCRSGAAPPGLFHRLVVIDPRSWQCPLGCFCLRANLLRLERLCLAGARRGSARHGALAIDPPLASAFDPSECWLTLGLW